MIERLRRLCADNGTTFSAVEKALGLGNASLKKAGESMQAWRLKKLADYFGVSMEYLLTGAETANNAFSAQERELLRLYRSLTPEGRTEALERVGEMTIMDKWTKKGSERVLSASAG